MKVLLMCSKLRIKSCTSKSCHCVKSVIYWKESSERGRRMWSK
jgi:hypothetical protein